MVLSGSYINKINKVSALRSSAGAVHVGHPYGTSERDSSCTTTDLGPTATGWSNWVGRIHIMCSGPLRDLYGTPGAP